MRISRFFAGGLVSTAVVVMLSGCSGAPPLTIYGGLVERCFETRTTDDGFFALVGITVTNDTSRSVILREARVLGRENAVVRDIAVVPVPSPYSVFGVAPGGELSPEQRALWRDRTPVDGTVIGPLGTAEIVVELHARDVTKYAGISGVELRYDDGWFAGSSEADATVGFVPPWARCSAHMQ